MTTDTSVDAVIKVGEPVPLDLTVNHYRGEQYPFRVRFHFDALVQLFNDALQGTRIYELMMIRRPGDVWNYVWIETVELPPRIQKMAKAEYARQSEGFIQFPKFDGMFRWAWMDTEPEDECWLHARGERPFRELADQLFLQVTVVQAKARKSQDILTAHVISAMESRRHAYDYLLEPPMACTSPGYSSNYHLPKHSPDYYQKLESLLASPETTSVGFSYDDDFQAIRLACAEQRKRADASGKNQEEAFYITMLSDGRPYIRGWEAAVRYYAEGLGWADLYVAKADTFQICSKLRHSLFPMFFVDSDAGEVEGYERLDQGTDWFLYKCTKSSTTLRRLIR
jgi:hypothetical protein